MKKILLLISTFVTFQNFTMNNNKECEIQEMDRRLKQIEYNLMFLDEIDNMYYQLDEMKQIFSDRDTTSIRIVMNPEKMVIKEAQRSFTYLNIYDFIAKMGGACYFYTKEGWIKNKNYTKIPSLRFEKPLKVLPKNLDFLYGKN